MVTRALEALLRTVRQRSMGLALLATGLCVGLTLGILRWGGDLGGPFGLLAVWLWGYFAAMFVVLVAYALAVWYLGDRLPGMETTTIIICAALVAVCFWLVVAHYWVPLDNYDFE